MTLFTRAQARDFRLLLSRCVSGRPRGPAPHVVAHFGGGVRTVSSTTSGGVTLTHASPAPGEADGLVVLPASVLAAVGGATPAPVTFDRASKLAGVLRWRGEGGESRELPVDLVVPGGQHRPPEPVATTPVAPSLLAALHECGRTASRDSGGRFALSMVQLRGGGEGRVAGTDCRVALLWGGFAFPFAGDVLVPALPVFGSKPMARAAPVLLGLGTGRLVVSAGPWSVSLPVNGTGRFPDVAAVVPRHAPTTVGLGAAGAEKVLSALPGLPGGGHPSRPVTLEAGGGGAVAVRGRGEGVESQDVALADSQASGPAVRAVLDRRVVARALSLGCRTLRLSPDNKPVAFEGGDITLVATQLDAALAAPAPAPAPLPPSPTEIPLTERKAMTTSEPNGAPHPRGDPTAPPDPLELAEELRVLLAGAAAGAARLAAALRRGRREKRVISALVSNLRQLDLGGRP